MKIKDLLQICIDMKIDPEMEIVLQFNNGQDKILYNDFANYLTQSFDQSLNKKVFVIGNTLEIREQAEKFHKQKNLESIKLN